MVLSSIILKNRDEVLGTRDEEKHIVAWMK